jgi:hypothetical protein
MVVILMNADGGGFDTGRALAADLGWPLMDARDPHALHAIINEVLGRREHLVVTSPVFGVDEQAIARGELRNVRFVNLGDEPGDTDEIVRRIVYDFGL